MEIDNRYWAGFFDGEGHISIAKDLVHMQVGVTQKEPQALYLMRNRFGGKVEKYAYQTCFKWRLTKAEEMERFLVALAPYLIVKAVEAQIALEMLKGWRRENKGCHPLEKEELERRRGLYGKFQEDRRDLKQVQA